jgi:hypothetical protein
MVGAALSDVLAALCAADNTARGAAEADYASRLARDPCGVAGALVGALGAAGSPGAQRELSAVLLRQLVRRREAWTAVDAASKSAVWDALLGALADAGLGAALSRKVVHVLVALPAEELSQRRELVPWTLAQVGACGASRRALFLSLLGQTCEFAFELVQAELSVVTQALSACMQQEEDGECRLAACDAAAQVALSHPRPQELSAFLSQAAPLLVRCAAEGLCAGNESGGASEDARELAARALESAQALMGKCMWALDAQLEPTCVALLQLVDCGAASVEHRCLALGVFAELFRRRGKALAGESPAFMERLLLLLLRLQAADSEFAQDWDDDQEADLVGDPLMLTQPGLRGRAAETLRAVAAAAPSAALLQQLLQLAGPALAAPERDARMAAITSLAAAAEPLGAHLLEGGALPELVEVLRARLGDAEPRVAYMAVAASLELLRAPGLAQALAGSFGWLADAMAAALEAPRVGDALRCAACVCLSELLERAKEEREAAEEAAEEEEEEEEEGGGGNRAAGPLPAVLSGEQQQRLLRALVCLVTGASLAVKFEALSALAAVAAVAGPSFGAFYDELVPGIKQLIARPEVALGAGEQQSAAKADALRAAAMACVAAIAEAVGRDRFAQDADQLLALLFGGGAAPERLAQVDGIFDFSARVARLLGPRFAPHLQRVLPVVYAAVRASSDVRVEDVAAAGGGAAAAASAQRSVEVDEESRQIEVVQQMRGLGTFRVTANIWAFQARLDALQALQDVAEAVGEHFAPFLEGAFEVVMPAIDDHVNAEATALAATAAGSLLHAAWLSLFRQGHSMEPAQRLLVAINMAVLKSLLRASQQEEEEDEQRRESDARARAGLASAYERCMRICFFSGGEKPREDGSWPAPLLQLPHAVVPSACELLRDVLALSVQRRVHAEDRLKAQGFEADDVEEQLEELNAQEEELAGDVVDAIGYIIKTRGPAAVPLFDSVLAVLAGHLVRAENPPAVRHNALCMYVDVFQYGGEAAQKYAEQAMPELLRVARNPDRETPELLQVACYGLGQAAESMPAAVFQAKHAKHVADALGRLALARKEARDKRLKKNKKKGPAAPPQEPDLVLENAAAAIARICLRHACVLPRAPEAMRELWLACLPMQDDEDEAQFSHRLLVKLVDETNGEPNRGLALLLTGADADKTSRVLAHCFKVCKALLHQHQEADKRAKEAAPSHLAASRDQDEDGHQDDAPFQAVDLLTAKALPAAIAKLTAIGGPFR